jgi:hypothetical protein
LLARIIDMVVLVALVLGSIRLLVPLVPDQDAAVALVLGIVLVFQVVQVVLLSVRGQHLGKLLLGLEIVRDDAARRGSFMRSCCATGWCA